MKPFVLQIFKISSIGEIGEPPPDSDLWQISSSIGKKEEKSDFNPLGFFFGLSNSFSDGRAA